MEWIAPLRAGGSGLMRSRPKLWRRPLSRGRRFAVLPTGKGYARTEFRNGGVLRRTASWFFRRRKATSGSRRWCCAMRVLMFPLPIHAKLIPRTGRRLPTPRAFVTHVALHYGKAGSQTTAWPKASAWIKNTHALALRAGARWSLVFVSETFGASRKFRMHLR